MSIVTLTTDFGVQDAYVGMMKGVIAGIAPTANVIDICHQVWPQDVAHGALVLWSAVPAFPRETVHCVVIDPGVGSSRRAVAVEAGGQRFVAPDNGVLWPALQRFSSWEAVVLNQDKWFRHPISQTFHGRDIFSPVSAHWAAGRALYELGTPTDTLIPLPLFDAISTDASICGRIVAIDHFGNMMTNIPGEWLEGKDVASIQVGDRCLHSLSMTFSDVSIGELVAFVDSFGLLEFAVRNGSAQADTGWSRGQTVEVVFR